MSFLSFNHHKDLPLDQDPGTRFLPWLIAFMVYLAALSIVATSIMQSVSARWERGVSDTLTVQIPPASTAEKSQQIQDQVLAVLRDHPAVAAAQPISDAHMAKLLEPWLGSSSNLASMPIPSLIDVSLKEGAQVDSPALLQTLHSIAPNTTLDDHRIWLDRLIQMSQSLQWGAYLVLIFIAIACVGTIFFVTKTGLAIHQDVIEVLHLIGAQDSYIARQFAEHALQLGLRGGLFGLAAAGPTFGAFAYLYRRVDSALLPQIDITPVQWVLVLSLPLLAAVIGYLTARRAVFKTLRNMV